MEQPTVVVVNPTSQTPEESSSPSPEQQKLSNETAIELGQTLEANRNLQEKYFQATQKIEAMEAITAQQSSQIQEMNGKLSSLLTALETAAEEEKEETPDVVAVVPIEEPPPVEEEEPKQKPSIWEKFLAM